MWYFHSLFSFEMVTQHPPLVSTSGKGCLAITAQRVLWLVVLVHQFCHPGKIWISTALAGGMVEVIEMCLNFDEVNCDINFN